MRGFKIAVLIALSAGVLAAFTWAAQTPVSSAPAPDPKLVADLVYANRILADQDVLDGFGHVSVRTDKDPSRFLMSRSMAPGLVTSGDILEFDKQGENVAVPSGTDSLARHIRGDWCRAKSEVGPMA